MPRLANLFWRAFTGKQAHLACGTQASRRYAPGFPPIIAFADPANPDFAALGAYCSPGDRFYIAEWRGPTPRGWSLDVDTFMCAMVFRAETADRPLEGAAPMIRLGPEHVPHMTALAALTKPGPFAERPMEIGEWYGIFDGDRLVAMAGERAADGDYREVSGVCTLPDYQGRGYAKQLTERVLRSQLDRGLIPFLHVASANTRARTLYERMGFEVDQEVPMRVVVKTS